MGFVFAVFSNTIKCVGRMLYRHLKEVRLAGNLPGQLQGTYVRCCVFTCVRAILESTPRVECTKVTSLFRLVTSNVILRGQLRRHQVIVHSQACHKFFAVRVVHVQWRTRVFLKFKSSCTVSNLPHTWKHLYTHFHDPQCIKFQMQQPWLNKKRLSILFRQLQLTYRPPGHSKMQPQNSFLSVVVRSF